MQSKGRVTPLSSQGTRLLPNVPEVPANTGIFPCGSWLLLQGWVDGNQLPFACVSLAPRAPSTTSW